MAVVSLALAGTAAAVAGRWWLRRVDSLGRPRSFPVWSVSLLALLAVGAAIPGIRRHHEESRLSSVATVLVGQKAVVHCQSTTKALVDVGAELGYVKYTERGPEHATLIKREQCGYLRHYLGHHGSPSQDEVVAVHVLTHESMHMRGEEDEAVAECEAVQRDAQTAQLLGASPEQASALAQAYWRDVYPRMPEGYRTADCGPGQRLDERLATAPW